MQRLHFGRRARLRQRRKRILGYLAFVSIVATMAGVPGTMSGVDLVERLATEALRRGDTVSTTESAASSMRFRSESFATRPTPTPSETEVGVTASIEAAAVEFGLDPSYLVGVAQCESNLDPAAYNSAGYHGLFQFDQQTWAAYGYGSVYDPEAQARTAARLLAAGQSSRWPLCA